MLRKNDLESVVSMRGALRTALIVHAAYFSVFPMMFEGALDVTGAILDKLNLNSFGHIPEKPDNLFWLMSNLCGELFFVAVVAYVMMASLSAVPRWTLLVPLAQVGAAHATLCPHIASSIHGCHRSRSPIVQVAYNLKNSLVWIVLYKFFSPTGTPILLMIADFMIIFPCAVTYTKAFLGKADAGSSMM